MEIYYENSDKTQRVLFDDNEYGIADFDLFQHEFKYTTENDKITKFSTGVITRTIEANVSEMNGKSWQELYDTMNGIFMRDVLLKKPGTLYVNDSYMPCYFYAGAAQEQFEDWGFQPVELKLVTDRSVWVTEQKISISQISEATAVSEEAEVKTYPYTYPYTYSSLQTETNVYVDHYMESDFQMTVFGPTTSALINIAGHPYEVTYPLEKGEYMVIDSRPFIDKEKRLYVVRTNGETENIFNYRSAEYSVFKKIPAGPIKIDYPRTYGVELIIFKERSEPPWKSSL